jgi:hypothetical protein
MDITLHNLDKFPSYADVSITHPYLKSYLDGAAVKAGSAASAREFRTFTQKIESAFKRNRGKENLAAFKTAF